MAMRYWLGLGAGLWCVVAVATQPPQSPAPPGAPHVQPPDASGDAESNDELIEFLGADDVGDAAWWEFLKKSSPRKDPPLPAPPSQDARS